MSLRTTERTGLVSNGAGDHPDRADPSVRPDSSAPTSTTWNTAARKQYHSLPHRTEKSGIGIIRPGRSGGSSRPVHRRIRPGRSRAELGGRWLPERSLSEEGPLDDVTLASAVSTVPSPVSRPHASRSCSEKCLYRVRISHMMQAPSACQHRIRCPSCPPVPHR